MEVLEPLDKVKDEEYQNYIKLHLALYYLKNGICTFIEEEVNCLHESLKKDIYGNQTEPLPQCTSCCASNVKWNKLTGAWGFDVRSQCQSKCDVWFNKLLELHANHKSKEIYWENSNVRLWPYEPWECAKVFIPRGRVTSSVGPDNCNAQTLMTLLENCRHFRFKLSTSGHGLVHRISGFPDKVTLDGEMKLSDDDRSIFTQEITELLEDDKILKSRQGCIAAVENIKKIEQMSTEDFMCIEGQNPCPIKQKQFQSLPDCDPFPTLKRRSICMPNNHRRRQIIKWTVENMEKCIGTYVGGGAFGTVHRAKFDMKNSPMLCGNNRQYVIKKIKTHEPLYQKSYEREIYSGRILHPFINPIIARAESLPNQTERSLYLMFPYMLNRHLRDNIEKENKKRNLSKNEANAKIWTRCICQIAQAVDYLHMDLSLVRGPVFHRDLTSNNILFDENFNIRIGDFGIAVEAKMQATEATHTGRLGTKGYHPPHMDQKYIAAYDIFSVGVIMLEILTGEKAVCDKDDSCLYEKYQEDGLEILTEDLDTRAKDNKCSIWPILDHRNKIAEIAIEAVNLNEAQKSPVNLLQKLEEMRLSSIDCYRSPQQRDRCVSCYVNTPVQLSLMGQKCIGYERKEPCQPFCLHCLTSHHYNPLVCPEHGKTRPPFAYVNEHCGESEATPSMKELNSIINSKCGTAKRDHVYGVFVAGSNVEEHDGENYAKIFMADVDKVVNVLTKQNPFETEARKDHFKTMKPNGPDTEENMETQIKNAFEDLNSTIKKVLQENNMKPEEDRLPSSLFIFYYSGHCSAEKGLYIGSARETISASTPWIKEMLHVKLGVDKVLVILDCCEANSQNFLDTEGLNVGANSACRKQNVKMSQLSSCDTNETSRARIEPRGSKFTHFLCQGLQGLDRVEPGDKINVCDSCEKHKQNDEDARIPCIWYHTECSKDHTVTLFRLIDYIQGHFDLLKDDNGQPVKKMTVIHDARGGLNICMGYYNPEQFHVPIDLSGPQGEHTFVFAKPYPESINGLKEDIIKYTEHEEVTCNVLSFHRSYSPLSADTRDVIGIYPKYGRNRKMELATLDSIYRVWSNGVELEARVRDNVEGLSYGPVKLDDIKKSMVTGLTEINTDSLKLNSDVIQIPIKSIPAAKKQITDSCSSHKEFVKHIQDVLTICRRKLHKEKKEDKVLKFCLYDEFCVLKMN